MAPKSRTRGTLIALEGTRAVDLRRAAGGSGARRSGLKGASGVSWWDASGAFYEIWLGKRKHVTPSPRTLLLLYASDLAFRLRWEIQPALASGQTVIAAPYRETAIVLGRACGLSRGWLLDLLRFAPAPDTCYRVREGKSSSGWKGKATDGFAEFCSAVLSATTPSFDPVDLRRSMIALLDAAERRHGCRRLT